MGLSGIADMSWPDNTEVLSLPAESKAVNPQPQLDVTRLTRATPATMNLDIFHIMLSG
jgi:hypothetical protein